MGRLSTTKCTYLPTYLPASGPMRPGGTAFTIRCIGGSSAGAPAPFRARTAGGAASPRKVLAPPAASCWAAACAACVFVTASTTKLRTVAPCAQRRALGCSGPFPLRQGMVLWALRGVASGRGQGANMCDRCATDVGSRRCTWIHRSAASAGPAWPGRGFARHQCAGAMPLLPCACAGPRVVQARCTRPPGSTARTCWRPLARRRTPSQTLRRAGRGVGGQRPVTRGRDGRARGRPTFGEGGPGVQAGGRDTASVVPTEPLLPNRLPRVV